MNNQLRLPRAGVSMALAAAACVFATWISRYFGAEAGGMALFLCCLLLMLCTAALRPTRKEAVACAVTGAAFGIMHTLGYSYDTMDSYGLILKNAGTLVSGALCMIALSAMAFCVCLILVRVLDAMKSACAREDAVQAGERKKLFYCCAGMIFLGSVPYLALYAPGLNIFDTHDQLLQFFGYPSYIGDGSVLTDHHPVFLSVVYAGFIKVGLLLGHANIGQMLYSLTSMAVLSAAWAYALCTLYDLGLKRKACLWIAGFVALYPVLALYAFNMCKDVSAAPFVLLYAAQMVKLHRSRGEKAKDRRFLFEVAASTFVLMLTRKPSMYALAFAAVFQLVFYRCVRARLAAALVGSLALFFVGYNSLLLPALRVVPGETREMLSIPFQMTARYFNTYPDDVRQEELEAVSRVLDVESFASYDPRLSDPVKDTSNPEMNGSDLAAYAKAWLSMGLRHPGVYLDAWLNMIYGYFYPSTSNTIVCLTLNSPEQGGMNLRQDEKLNDLRLKFHDFIYYTLRRLPGAGMLFFVNTVTWAFLFLLVYAVLRGGIGAAVPWIFFFGTLGICMLSPKSGEIRYLMPILYGLPVMLGAVILPEKKEKKA